MSSCVHVCVSAGVWVGLVEGYWGHEDQPVHVVLCAWVPHLPPY